MSFLQRLLLLVAGTLAGLTGFLLWLEAGSGWPTCLALLSGLFIGLGVAFARSERKLLWTAGLAAFWLLFPTAVGLWWNTQLNVDNDTMRRIGGETGYLVGSWEGEEDFLDCGYYTRTRYHLTLRADGTGFMEKTSAHSKVGERWLGPDGALVLTCLQSEACSEVAGPTLWRTAESLHTLLPFDWSRATSRRYPVGTAPR